MGDRGALLGGEVVRHGTGHGSPVAGRPTAGGALVESPSVADVRPFRALTYTAAAGPLGTLLSPPYDVISPDERRGYLAVSPYNAVRLILPEVGYDEVAGLISSWRDDGVLDEADRPVLIAWTQSFTLGDGVPRERRTILATVTLEPYSARVVRPHERTHAGPKEDRLRLTRAVRTNLSPVFGLYPDEANEVFAKLEPQLRKSPPLVATDHLGVVNRLWVVTDSATISSVIGLMGPKPVFIADGHHRYETGLKYLDDQRAAGAVPDDESAPNFCLMMLVSMSDPGLVILPTHRLVSGVGDLTGEQLRVKLATHFDIVGEFASDAAACWEHVELEGSQLVLGFGSTVDNTWFAARLRDPSVMDGLAPDQSSAWRGLAISILHKLVLEKLLGGTPACQYVHLLKEVTDAVAARACQVACLVPPVGMSHVEQIAGGREKMPPKSTYFYPKLLTGMVFNSLKRD